MNTYFDHVGQKGADAHFPLTIHRKVSLSQVSESFKDRKEVHDVILKELKECFPSGEFNCWGVPRGANTIVKNMKVGDLFFLVETTHFPGSVPAMGEIKVFEKIMLPELSFALWGDDKYPYVFFFDAEKIELEWVKFLELIGYKERFDPRGTFCPVREERLLQYGGSPGFQDFIRKNYKKKSEEPVLTYPEVSSILVSSEPNVNEYSAILGEANKILSISPSEPPKLKTDESSFSTIEIKRRNIAFRALVCKIYNWKCAVCGLSLSNSQGKVEVEAAHIYPKYLQGSDDPRNGICLCRTHHWSFDNGLFTISDDLQILVAPWFSPNSAIETINKYNGSSIVKPIHSDFNPHPLFLEEHRKIHNIVT